MDISIKLVTTDVTKVEIRATVETIDDAARLIDLIKANAEAAFPGSIIVFPKQEESECEDTS